MKDRYHERDLILPALYYLKGRSADTSKLIELLTESLHPTGLDAEILSGRNDTRFSQKVRNLMGSHYHSNGMDLLTEKHEDGSFTLTPAGEELLDQNLESLELLFSSAFTYDQIAEISDAILTTSNEQSGGVLFLYDENETIKEGMSERAVRRRRKRSALLRAAAIAHYTDPDGHIRCAACGFDFLDVYGERGKGFIEIHHERPIYQKPSEGTELVIKEAVKQVKPLCANCHRMIHRDRKTMLTVSELKTLVQQMRQQA